MHIFPLPKYSPDWNPDEAPEEPPNMTAASEEFLLVVLHRQCPRLVVLIRLFRGRCRRSALWARRLGEGDRCKFRGVAQQSTAMRLCRFPSLPKSMPPRSFTNCRNSLRCSRNVLIPGVTNRTVGSHRRIVREGSSPKSCRYFEANRPWSQKPHTVVMSVSVFPGL